MEPGQKLGNYTVGEKIGAGGMGEVYRATDSRLGRDVAIKAMPAHLAGDPEYLARFDREAQTLATLNHPGIGSIYGLEELDGHRYLVLELIGGPDLADRIAAGPVPVEDAVTIGVQLAEALEAAHDAGVVHRDLKPGNIKLTTDGKVKILDFGLAKTAAESTGSGLDAPDSPTVPAPTPTASGAILGTSGYMSPEQARGLPVDRRTDVFAFGVVMMEMLTGARVFQGQTQSDVLAALLREEPRFEDLPAGTPAPLRRLLQRCLRKDARRRLRDMGDVRIVLEDIAAGTAEDGAMESAAASSEGGRRWLAFAGCGAAIVLAGLLAWTALRDSDGPAPDTRVEKLPITMPADEPTMVHAYHAALSPDGTHLAYTVGGRIVIRDFAQLEPIPLPGTEGARSPFWSPDGQWIGFMQGTSILKVPRSGGQPTLVYRLGSDVLRNSTGYTSWGTDGTILFCTGTAGVFSVPENGGEARPRVDIAEGETDFHEMAALPDGNGIVVVVHNRDGFGTLHAVAPDGTRHPLVNHGSSVRYVVYSPTGHIVYARGGGNDGIWAFPFSVETLERTGEPFPVAPGGNRPSVSRDGTLAYGMHTEGESRLVLLDRAGERLRSLGDRVGITRPHPDISPDGTLAALPVPVDDHREIFLTDLRTGSSRRFTHDGADPNGVVFTPDGRGIVHDTDPGYRLVYRSLDGAGEPRDLGPGLTPAIGPDGQMAYSRTPPDAWNWDLYRRPIDGTEADEVPIAVGPGQQWTPDFSPDGRYLAYASEETGRFEVFVTTFPDADRRWQISTDGGMAPRWARDGSELYFSTIGTIFAVDVGTEGGFRAGPPVKLFDRPTTSAMGNWADGFDVTPEGEFLMLAPVPGDHPPQIVINRNWMREFE